MIVTDWERSLKTFTNFGIFVNRFYDKMVVSNIFRTFLVSSLGLVIVLSGTHPMGWAT